jgi:hypothetical protein
MSAYLLDVTLAHIRPKIWRRLHVPGDLSLGGLHEVLQLAFGWQDCHLHEFQVGEQHYGVPDPEGDDEDLLDDADISVARVLPRKSSTMQYVYDYGDEWIHNVAVHRIEELETTRGHRLRRTRRAGAVTCLAGARACPPEDCGGPHGYAEFLEAITSPAHPEHDAMLTWVGGAFDPVAFSLGDINRRLSALA